MSFFRGIGTRLPLPQAFGAMDLDELEGPLDEALRRAPGLLQHPCTRAAATRALLARLPCEEARGARSIAALLSAHGERSLEVSTEIFAVLPLLDAPACREVLGHLPTLVGGSDAEADGMMEAARAVMAADRSLLVPAIGATAYMALCRPSAL